MRYDFDDGKNCYCLSDDHPAASYGHPVIVATDWTGAVQRGDPVGAGDDPGLWELATKCAALAQRNIKREMAYSRQERDHAALRDLAAHLASVRWALTHLNAVRI